MVEKQIAVLNKQIKKLGENNFDLEAWKSSTVAILTRMFGDQDPKIDQINKIRIDYGSWALRDASSRYNPVKSCKEMGKEILEASINELETFGPSIGSDDHGKEIAGLLEEELKVAQIKAIKAILESHQNKEEKFKQILKKINTFPKDTAPQLLSRLLIALNINEHLE